MADSKPQNRWGFYSVLATSVGAVLLGVANRFEPPDRAAAQTSYGLTRGAVEEVVEDVEDIDDRVRALELDAARSEGRRDARRRMANRAASSRALSRAMLDDDGEELEVDEMEWEEEEVVARRPLRERVNLPEQLPAPVED